MTLTELSAPPLRGIDSQVVIVERPMDGEIEPFIRYKLERGSLINALLKLGIRGTYMHQGFSSNELTNFFKRELRFSERL